MKNDPFTDRGFVRDTPEIRKQISNDMWRVAPWIVVGFLTVIAVGYLVCKYLHVC